MRKAQGNQFVEKKAECLNCGYPTRDKFCAHCAQSTHTKRLNFRHFIMHDIVHGVMHMNKGFPKTLENILGNPGRVAWNYILGKRNRYYNFFYMLLIINRAALLFEFILPICTYT